MSIANKLVDWLATLSVKRVLWHPVNAIAPISQPMLCNGEHPKHSYYVIALASQHILYISIAVRPRRGTSETSRQDFLTVAKTSVAQRRAS